MSSSSRYSPLVVVELLEPRLLLDRLARWAAILPWIGSGTSLASLSASATGMLHGARDVADARRAP